LSPSFTNISSFIGTEIGDPYSDLAEKSPRTAKHVVTLFWSWSPAHSRRSEYRLATDRHRKTWNLYEITDNPEARKPLCCRVATGEPYKGIPAESAAYQLLLSTWDEEIKQWDFDPKDFEIDIMKMKKYKERRGDYALDIWKHKGLVECPVCEMVYSTSEWAEPRWKELNRRKVTQRPKLKSEDGRYRCVVPGCEWGGTLCLTHLKTHLMNHTCRSSRGVCSRQR
jgi:hypothetical protein